MVGRPGFRRTYLLEQETTEQTEIENHSVSSVASCSNRRETRRPGLRRGENQKEKTRHPTNPRDIGGAECFRRISAPIWFDRARPSIFPTCPIAQFPIQCQRLMVESPCFCGTYLNRRQRGKQRSRITLFPQLPPVPIGENPDAPLRQKRWGVSGDRV
jgi:hypothetical protein